MRTLKNTIWSIYLWLLYNTYFLVTFLQRIMQEQVHFFMCDSFFCLRKERRYHRDRSKKERLKRFFSTFEQSPNIWQVQILCFMLNYTLICLKLAHVHLFLMLYALPLFYLSVICCREIYQQIVVQSPRKFQRRLPSPHIFLVEYLSRSKEVPHHPNQWIHEECRTFRTASKKIVKCTWFIDILYIFTICI